MYKLFLASLGLFLVLPQVKGNDDTAVFIRTATCSHEDEKSWDRCMGVKFSNGKEDVMLLNRYNGLESVMMGTLKNEPSVYVALSKEGSGGWEGQQFMATFFSKHQPKCGSFRVNQDGRAACLNDLIADRMRGKNNFETDYVKIPSELQDLSRSPLSEESRALNPSGYKLDIIIYYSEDVHNKFGSEAEVQVRVAAVMAHCSIYFSLPHLPRFQLNLTSAIRLKGERWTASGHDLHRLGAIAAAAPDASAYVFLGYENNTAGIVGLAYMSTICGSKRHKISTVEYLGDDANTAQNVAHELGHNLGMDHDFTNTGALRYAKDGSLCTYTGCIMGGGRSCWSKCSMEDLSSRDLSCLKLLPATVSTTTTTTSTTPSTTTTSTTTSTTTTTTTSTTTTSTTTSTTTTTTTSTTTTSTTTSTTTTTTTSTTSTICSDVMGTKYCIRYQSRCNEEHYSTERCRRTCKVCAN